MTKAAVATLVGFAAIASFFVGLVVAGSRGPGCWTAVAPRNGAPVADARPLPVPLTATPVPVPAGGVDFAAVAAHLNRAVVNVDTASRTPEDRVRFSGRYPR